MRADAWHEILDSLIIATQERRANWTDDTKSGGFELSRDSGSVVVRGGRDVVVLPVVEIKDARGEVIDVLGGPSLHDGPNTTGGHEPDDFEALDALHVKARRLQDLIAAGGTVGEDLARRIVSEI